VPPRAPELRPYRIFAWTLWGILAAVPAFLLIRSVVLDLYGRPPPYVRGAVSPSRCLGDLERLFAELNSELWTASARGRTPAEAAAGFNRWALRWEHDLEDVQARCALDGAATDPTRAALAEAAAHLTDLRAAYVAHMDRFVDQGGPEAKATREALERARALLKSQ